MQNLEHYYSSDLHQNFRWIN